jgi:hypothetical protein
MLRYDETNGESTEYRVAVTLAEDVWSGLSHAGWVGWAGWAGWLAALVGLRPGVTARTTKDQEQEPLRSGRGTAVAPDYIARRRPATANRQHRRASPGSSRLFLRLWLATLHHSQTDTYPLT